MSRAHAAAWTASAAVVLSAPFAQQAFTEIGTRFPEHVRPLGIAASAVPAGAAVLVAVWRIRDRRLFRYAALALGVALAAVCIHVTALTFPEAFHFTEYGLLAILFYGAWRPLGDGSRILLPLVAGAIVGTLDEWFQWFIPIRAGEARDVLINLIATACGLLVALAIDPPASWTFPVRRRARARVVAWTVTAGVIFGLFFETVHFGYDVHDPELGSFRSRYSGEQLLNASRDRADRWRRNPPVVQRRLWAEDHYLTEGLWHAQQRNEAWSEGDAATAWRENRILEKFYAPLLQTPTYAGAEGHRWPAEQREAAARAAAPAAPVASDAYPYPLYLRPSSD